MSLLEHGGRLRAAADHYDIPLQAWLDLSTGINPHGYPVPPVPAAAWQRLPEAEDGLPAAAAEYYGCRSLLVTAGSQAAIQALPRLFAPGRVAVRAPAYNEHPAAWRAAGHAVAEPGTAELERDLERYAAVVVINPNNPDGQRLSPERLLRWHARLQQSGGTLVVDEAFMDATPADSLASHGPRAQLVVLRSLGKFFGLAGARVGFVLADAPLLQALEAQLGPWPVAGPSRHAARAALQDRAWQQAQRVLLAEQADRLRQLLTAHRLPPQGQTALFAYCPTPAAARLQELLARQAVLVRRFDRPAALRFGLPGSEAQWRQLETALTGAVRELEEPAS